MLATDQIDGLEAMAANPWLPLTVVEALLNHPSADVRRGVAERDDLAGTQLARLAADPDASGRTAVSVHPALTEQQRAAIDIDVTTAPGDGWFGYRSREPWMPGPEPLPPVAESVGLAASVNPPLRRRAAIDPRLPTAGGQPHRGSPNKVAVQQLVHLLRVPDSPK